MTQDAASPAPVAYKDRKTALNIFGFFTFCLGALCALMVALMLLSQLVIRVAPNTPQNSIDPRAMWMVVLMYGGIAIVLVTLGIGSMLACRWARALILIFSWFWLLTGIIGIISMIIVMNSQEFFAQIQAAMPANQSQISPAAFLRVMFIGELIFMSIFFVVLPAIWIWFYNGKNVKATCEARHPDPSWTDRCPLPVLAISLFSFFGALCALIMPLCYHSVLPAFGVFLTGTPALLAYVVIVIYWMYCARAIYLVRLHGWWMVIIALFLYCVSASITFSHHNLLEFYSLSGYSEQQMEQLKGFPMFNSPYMVLLMSICMVPWLLYLLWIRRYFRASAAS